MILYKGEHLSQSLNDIGNVRQFWNLWNSGGNIARRPGWIGLEICEENFSKSLKIV